MLSANVWQRLAAGVHEAQYLLFAALRVLLRHGPQALVVRSARWMRLRRSCREFDERFGVDTAHGVAYRRLKLSGRSYEEAEAYQPTPPMIMRSLLQHLPVATSNYTFVDLGCGKGVALLHASAFPFKRIIGVELVDDLYQSALRNVERYRAIRGDCSAIEVLQRDAAEFVFPDDPLIVYLFNPFGRHVMAKVLANLRASLAAAPRDLWVAYVHPVLKEQLNQCDFLKLHCEGDTLAGVAVSYAVYALRTPSGMGTCTAPHA